MRVTVLLVGRTEGGFRGFPGPCEETEALLMEKWQETRAARWEDMSKAPEEQSALEGWAGGQRDASDYCDSWAG